MVSTVLDYSNLCWKVLLLWMLLLLLYIFSFFVIFSVLWFFSVLCSESRFIFIKFSYLVTPFISGFVIVFRFVVDFVSYVLIWLSLFYLYFLYFLFLFFLWTNFFSRVYELSEALSLEAWLKLRVLDSIIFYLLVISVVALYNFLVSIP